MSKTVVTYRVTWETPKLQHRYRVFLFEDDARDFAELRKRRGSRYVQVLRVATTNITGGGDA